MRFFLLFCSVWILVASGRVHAGTEVQGVRLWAAPDHTRVVFDINRDTTHSLFRLHNPERLVIDLENAVTSRGFKVPSQESGLVRGLRTGKQKQKDLRIVLDLAQAVRAKSFLLKPNEQYGYRLVIDLEPGKTTSVADTRKTQPKAVKSVPAQLRDLVIAIDAGHGGEDPGAQGRKGTREKDVVLSIARRLASLVNQQPGMKAVLIRDGDYYVGLRQRIHKARQHKADLFVSIHADAFKDAGVRGSSVYVLSKRGASSEMARWVAARENAADLVGGVSLDDKDDLLAEVLLDLSQTATIEASMDVADSVLTGLKQVGDVHKRNVQHAAFAVLKSPDIPSILVETAFISNPAEERKLRDTRHQQQLAHAILKGIRAYFTSNPPPGTLMAERGSRTHVVRSGDTLGHIARRYGVDIERLRISNNLRGDTLYIGKTLNIPEGS